MNFSQSKKQLEERLLSPHKTIQTLAFSSQVIHQFFDFYEQERAEDCWAPEQDGDMLIIQWAPCYSAQTPATQFEFSFTRQFISKKQRDDASIWQLTLRFLFPLQPQFQDQKSGASDWLWQPQNSAKMKQFIIEQPVTSKCLQTQTIEATLTLEPM